MTSAGALQEQFRILRVPSYHYSSTPIPAILMGQLSADFGRRPEEQYSTFRLKKGGQFVQQTPFCPHMTILV